MTSSFADSLSRRACTAAATLAWFNKRDAPLMAAAPRAR
ncbi:hypothetical protein [Achromobacter phage CF418P1]|nr:hypothetical protein [Achromobacter phage CF418P1]